MTNFLSYYESIKMMDKQTFLAFPKFSENYKFEQDMGILSQNNNKNFLIEFIWMIKLSKIKVPLYIFKK